MDESPNPDILSPEWNDYVMTLFTPNELFDGYPLTAGLRRIAEKLIGPIDSSRPTHVFPVQGDGVGRATVVYEIAFLVMDDSTGAHRRVIYGDVADVFEGNTDDKFLVHAVATAATRAEGRALRKALKLRTLAAEELTKKDASKYIREDQGTQTERISNEQINFVDSKCRLLDIDVIQFINNGEKEYKSIYEVKRETAAKMAQELVSYNNDKTKIPQKILGYKTGWRENA